MARTILIRPLITEKAERLTSKVNQYSFVVDKKANKIEIKKAIEAMYGVNVESVNTLVMPAKAKNRNTRTSVVRGRVSSFKKAVVTLAQGEEIDFFGEL
ncbi:MAG: 50S ribosomal protein L23 [Lewinellaceae bacterium]|nr:50S ribosomal protein L23 [Lewinella sp.]MCB9279674.1 50S ribosomal protein L23 [Lewinellaceae bacterium]